MRWMSDLGGMAEHRTIIRASCQNPDCRHYWDWPVEDLLTELKSPLATIWDRHPPCEKDCGGLVLFLASPGAGTPMRPLRSAYVPPEGLPIQALMDGWFGMHAPPTHRPAPR